MGNRLTVEAREAGRPSQDNTATGNASMTNNQSTYTTTNYLIVTAPQLPSDTSGTNITLPPQVQVLLDVVAETTSQLPSGSGSTAQSPPNANDGSQLIRIGVWGHAPVGNSFKHKGFDGIKTIKICSSSSVIYSIEVEYTKDGELIKVEKAGGKDGYPQESGCAQREIVLETGEYIDKVSGCYGAYLEDKKVRSLTFTTNMNREFGPYGENANEDDENTTIFYVEGGRVVGFYGNAKNYISAIGFYVLPLNAREGNDRNRLIKVGLWGKQNIDHSFNHLGYEGIENLRISSNSVIDWFKVKYRNDNTLHREGGTGGGEGGTKKIVFEDGEYINKVIGYYGTFHNPGDSTTYETINQLTFTTSKIDTNTRIIGPYGMIYQYKDKKNATKFSLKGGRIVGFHGTGGKYVSSIGFYILPPEAQSLDAETTSQLRSGSGTTTQVHIPVNVTMEKTSQQLPSAPPNRQSPLVNLMKKQI